MIGGQTQKYESDLHRKVLNMTILLELRQENCDLVLAGQRPYVPSELTQDYGRFPTLWGVDPHDITIFNRWHMQEMLVEIEELLGEALSHEERGSLEIVTTLCREGLRKQHRYLWFIGIGDG